MRLLLIQGIGEANKTDRLFLSAWSTLGVAVISHQIGVEQGLAELDSELSDHYVAQMTPFCLHSNPY
jgi:hypothetical protein